MFAARRITAGPVGVVALLFLLVGAWVALQATGWFGDPNGGPGYSDMSNGTIAFLGLIVLLIGMVSAVIALLLWPRRRREPNN